MEKIHIYDLNKKRSPLIGKVYAEADEPWFIHIEFTKRKSGEVTDSHWVIQKDLPGWLRYLKNLNGWEATVVNEELVSTFCYNQNNP